jgi:hypothetical protein
MATTPMSAAARARPNSDVFINGSYEFRGIFRDRPVCPLLKRNRAVCRIMPPRCVPLAVSPPVATTRTTAPIGHCRTTP